MSPPAPLPGQGALAALVTLFGGKPLWDTYFTATNKPIRGTIGAEAALTGTRAMTVAFDAM